MEAFRQLRCCEGGAAAIEFAIISWVMILVSLGVIEFGRGLNLRNDLSFAADFAARKILTDANITDAALETEVRSALTSGDPDLLQVIIGTEEVDGVRFRTVTLSYPLTLLVPGLASDAIDLSLARRIPKV